LEQGIAIGGAGAAATAAVAEHPERPEVRSFSLIMVALGEAVAIYGIVLGILILVTPKIFKRSSFILL